MKLAVLAVTLLAAYAIIMTTAYVTLRPSSPLFDPASCIIVDGDTATSLPVCKRWR